MNNIQAANPEQVTIIIDGVRVRQFSNVSFSLSIDSFGTGLSFTTPFFPGILAYRDMFRPKKYQHIELYVGNDLKITGTVERISPSLTDTTNTVNVQARSKTGLLVDCTFSKDDQKEFLNADLEEIAGIVVGDLDVNFPDGAGAIFEQAGPDSPSVKKFNFLQNLAKQRGLLMGQTNEGKLLFRKPKTEGLPVAELIEGQQGLVISTAVYDGTKRFSQYDVFGQERGENANFARLQDGSIPIERQKSLQANDTNQGNIKDAAKWALSSDIVSAINIPFGYESWLRPDGKLWEENNLIILQAPSLMVYKPTIFLIKSIMFNQTAKSKTVKFGLTLPEAYTGSIPETFPWDE